MYVCLYVCMYVSIYVCMYLCMYVCIYVCMYVHTTVPPSNDNLLAVARHDMLKELIFDESKIKSKLVGSANTLGLLGTSQGQGTWSWSRVTGVETTCIQELPATLRHQTVLARLLLVKCRPHPPMWQLQSTARWVCLTWLIAWAFLPCALKKGPQVSLTKNTTCVAACPETSGSPMQGSNAYIYTHR